MSTTLLAKLPLFSRYVSYLQMMQVLNHGMVREILCGSGWEDSHDAESLDKITNMVNFSSREI